MNMLRKLIYYMFYPVELFLRFWFPYAFKDDPYNPEPQNKADRKRRKQDKKEERKNKTSPTTERRDNFKERKKVKDDAKNKENKNDERTDAEILANVQNLKQVNKQKPKELGLQMIDLSNNLNEESALEMLQSSESRLAFYWHDDVSHQVAVRFDKGGIKDEYKTRSNTERRQLEPLIRPYQKGNVDRTHVIPIGYHGSEKDKRLLIGFDSHINQVKLKNFEEYASKVNKQKTILWFVNIERQDNDSVKWHATVWGEEGNVIIKKTFHDKRKFKWSQRRF